MNNKISLNILKVLKESCLKESSIKDAESFIKQWNELEDSSESPEEFLDDYDFTCALGYNWLVGLAKKYPGKNKEAEKFIKEIEKAESEMTEEDEDVFEYTDTDDYQVIDLLKGYFNEEPSKSKSKPKKWYEKSPLYVSSKSKLMKPDNVETFEFYGEIYKEWDGDFMVSEATIFIKDPNSVLYNIYGNSNYKNNKLIIESSSSDSGVLENFNEALNSCGFELVQFTLDPAYHTNDDFLGVVKLVKASVESKKEFKKIYEDAEKKAQSFYKANKKFSHLDPHGGRWIEPSYTKCLLNGISSGDFLYTDFIVSATKDTPSIEASLYVKDLSIKFFEYLINVARLYYTQKGIPFKGIESLIIDRRYHNLGYMIMAYATDDYRSNEFADEFIYLEDMVKYLKGKNLL